MLTESASYENSVIKWQLSIFTKVMHLKLKAHIVTKFPFLEGKKLLIAISGGIDSTVLTHLMQTLNYSIALAHCNFLLRGKESNKDEHFVINLGKKRNLITHTTQFETKKYAQKKGISTQMAARELRYQWFQDLCVKYGYDYILTAHHKDDVLETFLINLIRGTGLNGLTGIPEINNNILRPLLPFTREEILIFATKNKLSWREDKSNSSIKYVRNKIRHKVIPVLKELNPNLLDTFFNTLENLNETKQIVDESIQKLSKKIIKHRDNEIYFNIAEIQKLSNPKAYLYHVLNKYKFTAWNDIIDLLNAQSGKTVFSKTHKLVKHRAGLILSKIEETPLESIHIHKNTKEITKPVKLKFETIDIPLDKKYHQNKIIEAFLTTDTTKVAVDFDKLQFPLTLRNWQKGDSFYPFGLKGKKKLSKFFKDEKLSVLDKEKVWLLCSGNQIVWVVGMRLDDRFKITNKTCKILTITQ